MNINIKNQTIGRFRRKIRFVFYSVRKLQKRRPLIENPDISARQWLDLDNYNSYPIPKVCLAMELKGECFRFYCVLLSLAKKFGNPFNYSDREFVKNYGFHNSRISEYKNKLEKMKLIMIALIRPPNLKWPKSYYLLFDFWNNTISPL